MSYLTYKSNYNKAPETEIKGYEDAAVSGYGAICERLAEGSLGKTHILVDCYPGVNDEEVLPRMIESFQPALVINTMDLFYDEEKLTRLMQWHLTKDRVRGIMYYGVLSDFIDKDRLEQARKQIAECGDRVLVYGFGAALVCQGDLLVYADMARWEIQLRYRAGMPNYKQHNEKEDFLRKVKRGFFVEWRVADRHKRELYEKIDFYLDTNDAGRPNMVTGEAFLAGLKVMSKTPFRLVPYFDPGVWGGQWMKEVCNLNPDEPNYAWSFDGVPEENSIYLRFGNVRVQSPAMNLTQYVPRQFLGEKTYARFGAEFPIRFDFLDTMGGQNLSLQVHPTTEYMKTRFGMPYTQDESYYILDAGENGGVYLGLKEGIDPKEMIGQLEEAQTGAHPFPAGQFVNYFPAKKHDHFLIPAGTVHCSSRDCMVLEISATPYIFTFKLWDWDRLGLDGLPRPIHIEDGKHVIQFDRDTRWVKENLINRFETLEENQDYTEVKTGLHPYEFIETHVFTIRNKVDFITDGEFAMLNLVEGRAALIESPEGAFQPYTVHYAETFILPAQAGNYRIRPAGGEESCKVLQAKVRY